MPWIVRGDVDGFFGLALDNLVQLLLIDTLCRGVLGFPADLVYGTILPGATFSSGVIELACAFVAERVRKVTPRAALLSTLAGIALSFISLGFLFRTFAHPVVGLTTLAIVMLTYFGRVRFKGHLPGGVVAVTLGTLLCWITGIAPVGARPSPATIHMPVPVVGDLIAAVGGGHVL